MLKKRFFGRLILTVGVMLVFSLIGCDDGSGNDDGGGVNLPPSSGTNEVAGITLYLSNYSKIVFASAGTAFEVFSRSSSGPTDYTEELVEEGLYSYNSESKTLTLAIEYTYWLDGNGNRTKMNKTQAVNAELKRFDDSIAYIRSNYDAFARGRAASDFISNNLSQEQRNNFYNAQRNYSGPMNYSEFAVDWLDKNGFSTNLNAAVSAWKTENGADANSYLNMALQEMGYTNLNAYKAAYQAQIEAYFAPVAYDYQLTTDDYLLVQKKLPANTGSNELRGNTFTANWFINMSDSSLTFTLDRFTATATSGTETVTGTYAYNSADKRVWFRPDNINNQTMTQFYASTSGYSGWGSSGSAANKAAETNERFGLRSESYSLNPNRIGYYPSSNE